MDHLKSINEFVGEISINDMVGYLDKMSYGMQDKLFFLDKIEFDCIVDFGAADGTMLSKVKDVNNSIYTIGYEIDPHMVNILENKKNIDYVSDNISDIFYQIKHFKSPILVLSSVIHEIYSYSSGKEVEAFWHSIYNSDFKYIVVRDMVSMEEFYQIKPNEKDVIKIRDNANPVLLKSYENKWGSISKNYNNLLHFLLKYKYEKNWEREVSENYLGLTIEEFKDIIPSSCKIIYGDHFILEFMKNEIKKDFNIDISKPTHMKVIIKNGN